MLELSAPLGRAAWSEVTPAQTELAGAGGYGPAGNSALGVWVPAEATTS